MTPYEEQKKKIRENLNASLFSRDSYSQSLTTNDELRKIGPWRPQLSEHSFNPDLDTSEGLYQLAQQAGLKDKADNAIAKAGGESQKYMSGGFIMDSMDLLNTLSYGVNGIIKGKGFIEGIKNRESMSDDDALGQYGWLGKIAGFAADIALDPLTYVAPWKQIVKVPGIAKTLESAKNLAFGELNVVDIGGQITQRREGGWGPLNYLSNRLVYGHAVDKNFRRSFETIHADKENSFFEVESLLSIFSKIDPKVSAKTLDFANDGSMISKNLDELQGTLSPEHLKLAEGLYGERDKLMSALIDEGVISKSAAAQHWNTYLKQSYDEFLIGKNKSRGKTKGIGLDNTRRVATKETREKLTFVDDAPAVWAGTFEKQIKLLYNARLNRMAREFSLDDAARTKFIDRFGDADNLIKVPDSTNYTIKGEEIDIKSDLKSTQHALKKLRKERAKTLGDESSIVNELKGIEKSLLNLEGASEKNFSEAISGAKRVLKDAGIKDGPRKKVPTSQGQKALEEVVNKFLKTGKKSDRLAREQLSSQQLLDEFLTTRPGITMMRAFDNPQMMYQWKSPLEFFDAIRYPDKALFVQEPVDTLVKISGEASDARIKLAEKQVRKMGKLQQTKDVLTETNLKLVRDRVDILEQDYADLLFKKQNILEALNENANGQLAGRWIDKDVWAMLKESTQPDKQLGETAVQYFKKVKVIWNPSAYARNAMSAAIQNWWRLGLGPWKIGTYLEASRELKNDGPIIKEMRKHGFSMRSGAINEILSNYVNEVTFGKKFGKSTSKTKEIVKHVDRTLANSYGNIDNVAKVAGFIHAREVLGWDPEKAMRAAYEATYNYSQVTPFVHQMRRAIWGVPFITFNIKSIGLVASTLKNAPNRISVFGKARNDLFKSAGIEGEQESETMPDWMRDDSFLMRLPWKDGKGRSMYFDLSYIMPIGAIMDGSYLKDPVQNNPVLQLVRELSRNKTASGRKIFNEFDDIEQVIADMFIHSAKLGLPPIVEQQLSKGYNNDGTRELGNMPKLASTDTQDMGPNERTFYQESFRLLGLNVSPFELDSRERTFDWNRKRNLQQMLANEGVLSEFTRPYLPKDSPLRPKTIYDKDVKAIGR